MKSILLPTCFAGTVAGLLLSAPAAYAQSHDDEDHAHGFYAPGTLVEDEFSLGTTSSAPGVTGKWGPPILGTGATVTWSIMDGGKSLAGSLYGGFTYSGTSVDLNTIMPSGYVSAIQAAFDAWSSVANIKFQYVVDSGSAFNVIDFPAGTQPNIRISAFPMTGSDGTLAVGYYPPKNGNTAAGDIHFNSNKRWEIGYAGSGYDVFQVVAHEIGHAIGLAHSATSAALMYAFYNEAFAGPQADDIAGAQYIYGAPVAVPEATAWAAGLVLVFGGLGVWRNRRQS